MTTTGQDFRLAIDKDHPQVPSSEGAGREEGGYLKEHGLQLQKITAHRELLPKSCGFFEDTYKKF